LFVSLANTTFVSKLTSDSLFRHNEEQIWMRSKLRI